MAVMKNSPLTYFLCSVVFLFNLNVTTAQNFFGGSTLIAKFAEDITSKFNTKFSADVQKYNPSGSENGVRGFFNATLKIAASETPLDASENAEADKFGKLTVPLALTTFSFMTKKAKHLKLTATVIAEIYKASGRYVRWNQLKAGLTGNIVPVARGDSSGTTKLISEWIKVSGVPWVVPSSKSWKVEGSFFRSTIQYASETSGVISFLASNPNAIGYVQNLAGIKAGLHGAFLKNPAGKYVSATERTPTHVIPRVLPSSQGDWSSFSLLNLPGDKTYPIITFVYMFMRKTGGPKVKKFLQYTQSGEVQDLIYRKYGKALYRLPSFLMKKNRLAIATISGPSTLFPAIFAFGDSTMDGGTNQYLIAPASRADVDPYGIDYIPRNGRYTNGKLIVDFISEYAGLPLLPPFLKPNRNPSSGLNFASGASGVLTSTLCGNGTQFCVALPTQTSQFLSVSVQYSQKTLSKSLFVISSGSNDYLAYFNSAVLQQTYNITEYVSLVVGGLANSIATIYSAGGRKFLIFNLVAIGCLPVNLEAFDVSTNAPFCLSSLNSIAQGHNLALYNAISQLEVALPGLQVITADTYSVTTDLVTNHKTYGFNQNFKACCGGGNFNAEIICSFPGSTFCSNRDDFLFWDSYHPTQASYEIFANYIIAGNNSYVYPNGLLSLV